MNKIRYLSVIAQEGDGRGEIWLPLGLRFIFLFMLFGNIAHAQTTNAVMDAQQHQIESKVAQWHQQPGWENVSVAYARWVAKGAANLPACQRPETVTLAPRNTQFWGQYQYTIGCAEPVWSYKARITVSASLPVWTTRTTLKRGHALNQQDLSLVPIDLTRLRQGFLTSADPWLAYRLIHSIQAGRVVSASDLALPLLVEKGERVTLRVEVQGLLASMDGEALESGSLGEVIRVKNLSSQRMVQGTVSGAHEVTIHY